MVDERHVLLFEELVLGRRKACVVVLQLLRSCYMADKRHVLLFCNY